MFLLHVSVYLAPSSGGNHVFLTQNRMLICSYNLWYSGICTVDNTGLSKKMDGIWNRYILKSTRPIYTFGVLKCSEKFKVLDLP